MNLIPFGTPALDAIAEYGDQIPDRLRGDVFSWDTETTGFDPHHGARIFCHSLCSNKGEKLWLPRTRRTNQFIMDLLNDPDKVVICQNGKFDMKMLTFEGWQLDDLRAEFHDTLAMGVILDELGSHDLGAMVHRWLGIDSSIKEGPEEWLSKNNRHFIKPHRKRKGADGCTERWINKKFPCPGCGAREANFSDVPQEIIQPYSEWDAEHTLKLAYFFRTPIKRDFWELYRNECDLIRCTIEMENHGVMVDMDRVDKLHKQSKADLGFIESTLREVVGRDFIIQGSGSRKDTIKAITEDLEWDIKAKTAKGNPQLDEFGLLSYLDHSLASIVREKAETTPVRDYIAEFKKQSTDPRQLFVPLMLKWRELSKMGTTYYKPIKRLAIPTEADRRRAVLHAKWNSLTAITGRFSSSKPNLQNIPRILGPRQCFMARPGFTNYHWDYDQVEIKLFVHYARDQKMKSAILAGADIHLETAREIFDKPTGPITKEERKKAKSTNFGIIYGSGAETLAITLTKMGIPTSEDEGYRYLMKYHKAKPSVRRVMGKFKAELQRRGYVQNEFGRHFRVPLKLSYKALNAVIQGCSADIMKRAMVRIWKYLKRNKCKSAIIMTIHDEIVVEIHHSEEEWLVPVIQEIVERDAPMFWVPITCGLERTEGYWSDKHDKTRDCHQKDCKRCDGRWSVGTLEQKCGCKCHEKEKGAA